MTVRRSDTGTVILDGVCAVEDAEPLLQMLQATPARGRRLDDMSANCIRRYFRSYWRRASPRSGPAAMPGWRQWLAPKLPQKGTTG